MASASQSREPARRPPPGWARTAGAYGVLFLFGLLQGLTGSLQYSRGLGAVPVAAIIFALAIGLTCWLSAQGMGMAAGAAAPAAGWVLASFALALPSSNGTVVITNSTAGQVYLYGGALCAAVAVGIAFSRRSRLP